MPFRQLLETSSHLGQLHHLKTSYSIISSFLHVPFFAISPCCYSDNAMAYHDFHRLTSTQFLSGVHYTKGDIVYIQFGVNAGQGGRVEDASRMNGQLKLDCAGTGCFLYDNFHAAWDISISLFNNRRWPMYNFTRKTVIAHPQEICLLDPWESQQQYHTPQPITEFCSIAKQEQSVPSNSDDPSINDSTSSTAVAEVITMTSPLSDSLTIHLDTNNVPISSSASRRVRRSTSSS